MDVHPTMRLDPDNAQGSKQLLLPRYCSREDNRVVTFMTLAQGSPDDIPAGCPSSK
jgi:hypothetical protein